MAIMQTGGVRMLLKEAAEKFGLFGGWPIVLEVDLVPHSLSLLLHKGTLPSIMKVKRIKKHPGKQMIFHWMLLNSPSFFQLPRA